MKNVKVDEHNPDHGNITFTVLPAKPKDKNREVWNRAAKECIFSPPLLDGFHQEAGGRMGNRPKKNSLHFGTGDQGLYPGILI